MSIKGGGGHYPRATGSGETPHSATLTEHIRSSEPRYWHSPQSTPPLAETWELLSRLACTPNYRHPRCKIVQCSRTPLCWTYGPAAGIRINPCVTVLPPASTIWDEEHAASSLVGSGPPDQNTDTFLSLFFLWVPTCISSPCKFVSCFCL